MSEIAVSIKDLTKEYTIYNGEKDRLLGFLLPTHRGRQVTALDHLDLEIHKGDIVGFLGLNGSGKSTLSRIIAGITQPTSGNCTVNGSVSMLSAGVGMSMQLTGRENIYYKCTLLGFTQAEIRAMEQSILDFADIGLYIDQPLRTYSSGMRSRLGFAISVHINPDILVVDEALAVGDTGFASKCHKWMREYSERGNTIIYVSHALSSMRGFCNKCYWLHRGTPVGYGEAENMLDCYSHFTKFWNTIPIPERKNYRPDLAKLQEELRAEKGE